MPELSWRAVLLGAGVALAIGVPTSILSGIVDSADDAGDDSSLVFVFFVVVLVGMALGGATAARRRPDSPLTHGAIAAFCAFVPIQLLGAASQFISDGPTSLSAYGIAFSAALLTTAGIIGAALSQRRR